MSSGWFFTRDIAEAGEMMALDGREARHASGARRLGPGAEVTLFDGTGVLAEAQITAATAREVQVRIGRRRVIARPDRVLHLAAALPKGDRQAVMLGMATQLGMTHFTPLQCTRSIVKVGRSFAERSERICIESCKQCRMPHLPRINAPAEPVQLIRSALERSVTPLIGHPGGQPIAAVVREVPASVLILIGPEGGFTDEEVAAAQHAGARICCLGQTLLRVETAAAAMLAFAALRG